MAFFSKKTREPLSVQVKGKQLNCGVCGNDHFFNKRIQLNTSIFTFLNIDWLNKNATCFVCSNCTHIIWFES
ncbi:hypothetical protein AREALGSMS7_03812 [Arenibacter algicola]|jgi:predicted nucleic-acid-binding Zn-ribbon protein|uniref:DNA-binding protein n=1 Tax=Arenibacter algicola TaxID=616991 RepID=A0A221V0W6_9FLAO|nr:hypothetical protein AREALGSMS7_03812 [Arenibacter algicola]